MFSSRRPLRSVKEGIARRLHSLRKVGRQISNQLYERLVLSRNKATLLRKTADIQLGEHLSPEEAIRDPLVLEFPDIRDEYSESALRETLLQHLADFLLDLSGRFRILSAGSAA